MRMAARPPSGTRETCSAVRSRAARFRDRKDNEQICHVPAPRNASFASANRCAMRWPRRCSAARSSIHLSKRRSISISEVRMSPDLKIATAFVSPLGARTTRMRWSRRSNKHAKFVRGRVSPALRQMKYMPEFRFRLDTSFDNFARIDELLKSPEVARDLGRATTRTTNNGPSRQEEGTADFGLGCPRQAGRHGLDRCGRQGQVAVPGRQGGSRRHARPAGLRHAADRARRGDQDGSLCSWTAPRSTVSRSPGARSARPTISKGR